MNWEEKYNAIAELVDGYRRERDEARMQLDCERRFHIDTMTARDALQSCVDRLRLVIEAYRPTMHCMAMLCEPTDDENVLHAVERVVKERDEARAEADRWKRSCNVFRERDWPKAFQATVTSLEQEVSDAHEQLAKLRKLSKPWEGDAYRRGAEAMREACAQWIPYILHTDCNPEEKMRALPIPEDKP